MEKDDKGQQPDTDRNSVKRYEQLFFREMQKYTFGKMKKLTHI